MSKEFENENIEETTEIEVTETKPSGNFKKFLIGSIVGALVGVAGTIFVKKKFTNDDYDDFDDDWDDDDYDDDFEDFEETKDNSEKEEK